MDFNLSNLKNMDGIWYGAGDIIFFEGDPGRDFYIIKSGAVKVVKFSNGNMRILRILREGSMFGELALFSGSTRTATVVADTAVELIKINNMNLFNIINTNAQFSWKFLNMLTERLEHSFELYEILHQYTIEMKIWRYLVFVVNQKKDKVNIMELPELIASPKDKILEIIEMWKKMSVIKIENGSIISFNEVMAKQLISRDG